MNSFGIIKHVRSRKWFLFFFYFLLSTFYFLLFLPALASTTDGTIDSTNKYAWGEKIGWLNFGTTGGNVHVTDSGLSGHVWSANYGWINLAPAGSGVANSEGILTGQAWGENLGYIDFNGVTISSVGVFSGTASGTIAGGISFDCTNCTVSTDWRPNYVRSATASGGGGGSGGVHGGGGGGGGPITEESLPSFAARTASLLGTLREYIIEQFGGLLGISPAPVGQEGEITPPGLRPVGPEASPFTSEEWSLLPEKSLREFVLSPLPRDIAFFTERFPTLAQTLREAGVTKQTDLPKLKGVRLVLPNLSKIKKELPTDILFAKSGRKGKGVDINIELRVKDTGETESIIRTTVRTPLELTVRPEGEPQRVRGYLTFISRDTSGQSGAFKLDPSLAALLPLFLANKEKGGLTGSSQIEERLVVEEFNYGDEDGDGIYSAEISVPAVDGLFEIITEIDYGFYKLTAGGQSGIKEIRTTLLVDPEGYVYEKVKNQELRIAGAAVFLYWLNSESGEYELWPARDYNQINPQVTDARGAYAFLVPEGSYYIQVEAPGYKSYKGEVFKVQAGAGGVHTNIELAAEYPWLKFLDWKTALLLLVAALLLLNFYTDRRRRHHIEVQSQ